MGSGLAGSVSQPDPAHLTFLPSVPFRLGPLVFPTSPGLLFLRVLVPFLVMVKYTLPLPGSWMPMLSTS